MGVNPKWSCKHPTAYLVVLLPWSQTRGLENLTARIPQANVPVRHCRSSEKNRGLEIHGIYSSACSELVPKTSFHSDLVAQCGEGPSVLTHF